jgi:iron-sulfur cluster assembly 2
MRGRSKSTLIILFRIFEKDGAQIIVDDTTLEFISGSIIDFKSEMIKQGFEVVANPNAEVGCSCGTSFSPKEK